MNFWGRIKSFYIFFLICAQFGREAQIEWCVHPARSKVNHCFFYPNANYSIVDIHTSRQHAAHSVHSTQTQQSVKRWEMYTQEEFQVLCYSSVKYSLTIIIRFDMNEQHLSTVIPFIAVWRKVKKKQFSCKYIIKYKSVWFGDRQ